MSTAVASTNTRTALWPERWPAIALQSCIDEVEAAAPELRSVVKWNLPCDTCPEMARCLNASRKSKGPFIYDREILTVPRSSESSLFPRELFEPGLLRGSELVPHFAKTYGIEDRFAVASAWDIAWSEKTGGDWMVKMTAVLDRESGKRRILDVLRVQKLSFAQQVQLIEAEWAKYHDDIVVIESDAAQLVWGQYVGETTAVPVVRHSAGGSDGKASKRSLSEGVPSLIMELESRRWQVPYQRGTFHHENVEVFLSEAEAFGWNDGKLEGVGEHDDTVMAWWHLSWAMNRLLDGSRFAKVTQTSGAHDRGAHI